MSLSDKRKLLRSVDCAALVDCGCSVYVWKDGSGAEIEYCPMHKTAPALVEALNWLINTIPEPEIELARSAWGNTNIACVLEARANAVKALAQVGE